MVNVKEDLTGQKFERLTVVGRADDYISPTTGKHIARWLCQCSCGNPNLIKVIGSHLKNKNTKSCGCLRIEQSSKSTKISNKKYNTYDLSGSYGVGTTSNDKDFLFDLEDYEKIKDYCWYINTDGYVVTKVKNSNIFLHRLVMGLTDKSLDIDHIHGKQTRNDNRKANLRVATRSQNNMNMPLRKDNKSGAKGVYFIERINKWWSYIRINGININLGYFKNYEDAVKARKEAEEKYFGEFSYDNSIGINTDNVIC